jgi:hypothetical protein
MVADRHNVNGGGWCKDIGKGHRTHRFAPLVAVGIEGEESSRWSC